jgi:hypothetical protein
VMYAGVGASSPFQYVESIVKTAKKKITVKRKQHSRQQ